MTINCPYLHDGCCKVAEDLTGLRKVPVCPDRCEQCLKHANPQAPNGVIALISMCAVTEPKERARVKAIVEPYIERVTLDAKTGKPIIIDCEYAVGPRCLIAERIAGAQVTTRTVKACMECLSANPSKDKNFVTVSLAISSLHKAGDTVGARRILEEEKSFLRTVTRYRSASNTFHDLPDEGTGTELHKLINLVGRFANRFGFALEFKITKKCKCMEHIREMNRRGPDWCEQNKAVIIGWLKDETERRGRKWSQGKEIGCYGLLNRAIARTRRKEKRNKAQGSVTHGD